MVMNKVILAGDTLSAAVKIGVAAAAVYGVYKLYQVSQDAKRQADRIGIQIEEAQEEVGFFITDTVNPASHNNFINQSFIGDILGKPVDAVIEFFRGE